LLTIIIFIRLICILITHFSDDLGLIGGVWLHRQGQEDVISSGEGADDDDISNDIESNCLVSLTCLDKAEISAFDSLQTLTADDNMPVSNVELLSSIDTVNDTREADNNGTRQADDEAFGLEDILAVSGMEVSSCRGNGSVYFSSMTSTGEVAFSDSTSSMRPRTGSMIESGKGDLTASPVRGSSSALSLPRMPSLLRVGASLAKAKLSLPWKSGSTAGGISDGQTVYIIEAAELISQAQEHEIANCYQAAFSKYKSGIAILLKGVQSKFTLVSIAQLYSSITFNAFHLRQCNRYFINKLTRDFWWIAGRYKMLL